MQGLPALFLGGGDVGGVIVDEEDFLTVDAIHCFEFLEDFRLRFNQAVVTREDAAIKAAHESMAL